MANPLPDWNKVAESFDLWLPHLAPVTDTLLDALQAQPGHRVLDLACGTGEPSLSLIRRSANNADIVVCDSAWGMVATTAAKAVHHRVTLSCLQMRAENLAFASDAFDRVVCRFGIMLFDDPLAGARELRRVLRPRGRLALAVWDRLELMPTMNWCVDVFGDFVDSDELPATARINRYGDTAALSELLATLDLEDATATRHTLRYKFSSFNAYWDTLVRSGIMQIQLEAAGANNLPEVRRRFERAADPYQTNAGLEIPHGYIVISGTKPAG